MLLVAIMDGDHLKLNGFLGASLRSLPTLRNAVFAEAQSELEASLAAGDSSAISLSPELLTSLRRCQSPQFLSVTLCFQWHARLVLSHSVASSPAGIILSSNNIT